MAQLSLGNTRILLAAGIAAGVAFWGGAARVKAAFAPGLSVGRRIEELGLGGGLIVVTGGLLLLSVTEFGRGLLGMLTSKLAV